MCYACKISIRRIRRQGFLVKRVALRLRLGANRLEKFPDRAYLLVMMVSPVRLALGGAMAAFLLDAFAADGDGHMVSATLAAEIADGLPKFEPARKLPDSSGAAVQEQQAAPEISAADIVRLPKYVVRESRPLNDEQMRAIEGNANLAMRRYLGDTNSLDRGILNHFTFPELWGKIPLLGSLPCPLPGMTNQERAMQRYEEDEKLSLLDDLMHIESLSQNPTSSIAKAFQREIRYTLKACP